MANIALGKLPKESEWHNSFSATNGEVKGYDINNGFTQAKYPQTFTIDLLSLITVKSIRFLLWDALGSQESFMPSANPPDTTKRTFRNYRYELQLSADGQNFDTYYSAGDLFGSNGWQIFTFENNGIKAQYVRLKALHNNANEFFHIVEFEIHDSYPGNNIHQERIGVKESILHPLSEGKDQNDFKNTLQEARTTLSKLNSELGGAKEKSDEVKKALSNLQLINRTIKFEDEAVDCAKKAKGWFTVVVIIGLAMILVAFYFYRYGSSFSEIEIRTIDQLKSQIISAQDGKTQSILMWADNDSKRDLIKTTVYLEFSRYMLVRVFVLSILGILLSISIRNYRSLKHNYVVNRHRALSLAISLEMNDSVSDDDKKDDILISVTDQVFKPSETGYLVKSNQKFDDILSLINKIRPN